MTALPEIVDVAVVGAGTAGLALAVALGQSGQRICVLEKHTEHRAPVRGEIIQPNGLAVLDQLGVLDRVRLRPHSETHFYHFCRIGQKELVRFDYRELSHSHPTTLVLQPRYVREALLEKMGSLPNVSVHTGAAVTGLLREGANVAGVHVRTGASSHTVRAKLVAGADGRTSRVQREMGVGASNLPYGEGYLTGLLPRPDGFDRDGFYYMGKREILGLFPISDRKLYFFYMLPGDDLAAAKKAGVKKLAERIGQIHPPALAAARTLKNWDDLTFFPCVRRMAARWYVPGAVLLGDAAHGVNPHTAQGQNLALEDALCLATAASAHLDKGRVPPAVLARYETERRPAACAMQRLGDELVLFWNAGNPALTTLRDMAFKGLSRNPELRLRVTEEIGGLRGESLSPWERARLVLGG